MKSDVCQALGVGKARWGHHPPPDSPGVGVWWSGSRASLAKLRPHPALRGDELLSKLHAWDFAWFSFLWLISPLRCPHLKKYFCIKSSVPNFFSSGFTKLKTVENPFLTNDGPQNPVSSSGCLAVLGISCLLGWMKSLVITLLGPQDAQLAKPHPRHLCGFSWIPLSNLNLRCHCQLPGKLNRDTGNIKWLTVSNCTTFFSWAFSTAGKLTWEYSGAQ
jgi:hypothetical protein